MGVARIGWGKGGRLGGMDQAWMWVGPEGEGLGGCGARSRWDQEGWSLGVGGAKKGAWGARRGGAWVWGGPGEAGPGTFSSLPFHSSPPQHLPNFLGPGGGGHLPTSPRQPA